MFVVQDKPVEKQSVVVDNEEDNIATVLRNSSAAGKNWEKLSVNTALVLQKYDSVKTERDKRYLCKKETGKRKVIFSHSHACKVNNLIKYFEGEVPLL